MDDTVWTVLATLAVGLLAYAGVVLTAVLRRLADQDAARWLKREETLRMIRWAAELAVSSDEARATLGVAALTELADSPALVQAEDDALLQAIAVAVVTPETGPLPEGYLRAMPRPPGPVAAAKLLIKLDKRNGRDTPEQVHRLAQDMPASSLSDAEDADGTEVSPAQSRESADRGQRPAV